MCTIIIPHFCFLDHEGDLLNMALVHYTFENEEHAIMPRPHGNSKSQSAYVRTLPSTLQKIRKVSQHVPPKQAVSEVSRSVGDYLVFQVLLSSQETDSNQLIVEGLCSLLLRQEAFLRVLIPCFQS